jgi:hypothetical protein
MDQTESRFAPSPEPASDDVASPFDLQPGDAADRFAFDPVPLRCRTGGLTPARQREYVEALADTGIVREAAARIGVSEQAINRVRRRPDGQDFDRACEAAHRFGARRLRSIAFERAIEGTLKGHYYHGELVSQERVYDNRLLIYLLGKTEPLLDPPEESRAICDDWEGHMAALEQGVRPPHPASREAPPPTPQAEQERPASDDDNPQVWNEDGIWWTYFPPPEDFDGEEEADLADPDYRRTLTDEEEAVMEARNQVLDEVEMARCCGLRDRYFGLPPRGAAGFSIPREAETNETNETSKVQAPHPTSKPPFPGILTDEPPGEPT